MPTAKKLPSGSYRVRVYSHTENGKKIYQSFTAATKKDAEMQAAEWANKKDRRKRSDLTVGEAIDGYIAAKEGVLSPSTIRGYVRMRRNNFSQVEKVSLKKVTSEVLQLFVSNLSRSMSTKSVRNIYALLTASISLYEPDLAFRVTLPTKHKTRQLSPSNEAVAMLFNEADDKLKICIALAAFGSLRRGEICGLKYKDIRPEGVYVHADMIQDKDNKWIYKDTPKEVDSVRLAPLPREVLELLGDGEPEEYIVKYAIPNTVSNRFNHLRKKLGITGIRFHDLRHYYASIGAVLGIPDNYLADFGGWKRGSGVMKEVYQNNITTMSELYARKMADYFSKVIDT